MDVSELMRIKSDKPFIRHPWETARVKVITSLIQKNLPSNLYTIIDIGSGDAYVLNELCKFNMAKEFVAIDTEYSNEIPRKIIAESIDSNIKLYSNTKEGVHLSGKGNELILLMDVLEHQQNDNTLLQEIIGACNNKSSYLLITVPAFNSIFSNHDVLLQHVKRYNRKELEAVCKQNNLQIIQSGYFFTSLLLIRCGNFLMEKIKPTSRQTSIEVWNKNAFITSLVEKLLLLDYKISCIFNAARINLPGLSCYCICKI